MSFETNIGQAVPHEGRRLRLSHPHVPSLRPFRQALRHFMAGGHSSPRKGDYIR